MKFLLCFRIAVLLTSSTGYHYGSAFHVAPSYPTIIRSTLLESTRATTTSELYASTTTTATSGSGSSATPANTQEDTDNTVLERRRTKQKIAIVGSGAVGCYYGGRLWEVGYDVSFYMRGLHYEKSIENGLNVTSVEGDMFIPPDKLKAYDNIQQMASDSSSSGSNDEDTDSDGFDWIIVALKSTAVSNIPELIYPLLNPNKTRVLCIMNGLIEDDIIKGLNQYHVKESSEDDNDEDETSLTTTTSLNCCKALYGGMALVCCNRINPGHVDHSYAGLLSGGVAATHPSSCAIGKEEEEEAENRDAFVQLWEPTKIDIVYEPCLLAGRWRKVSKKSISNFESCHCQK